jgi:hypothetical protein
MADDISLVVGVDYKELTGFIKTSEQSKRVIKSVAQEFAKTGDQKAYMSGIMRVVMAQKNLDAKARKSQSEIMKLGHAMRQQAVFSEALRKTTDRTTKSIEKQGKVVGATKNRMNGTNMAIQQLGYQFGDFAVQVQGGTSAFVAFSQQGSQLAGILPMIAGPLGISMGLAVGLSSAFGILIPVGSALARTFFDVGKAADKSANDLKDALSEFQSVSEDLSEVMKVSLASPFTEAKSELQSLLEAYKKVKAEVAKDALATSLMPIVESVGDVLSEATRKKETTAALNIGKSQEAVANRVKRLSGLVDIQLEAADILNLINDAMKGPTEDLAPNMLKVSKALRDSKIVTHGIKDDFLKIIAESGILADIQKGYSEEQRSAMEARRAAGMAYGKQEDAINADIHQSLVDRILEEHETRVKADQDAVELRRTAGEDFFRQEQELEADIHKMRVDNILNEAALRATTISLARAKFNAGAGQYGEASQDVAAQRLAELRKAYADSLRPGKTKESDLQKLREELALESALVGQTEARQRVIQALGVEFSKKNPQTVASLEKQIQLTKELIQEEQQRQDLINFVADSMGDSFMSMVEGTKSVKDAFREMASDIVKELYRVLVVQQMVNSAKTFLGGFFADGGAFSGGSQIQAYADGGVVGSPTYFGMSGGKTGLMGEAGPEAIMPLSRGANGKLGVQAEGVGGVTINQNINISTGVQQTVRSEIKSMMPQIAEQSKAAVLDAKRRGGSYGGKF